MSPEGKVALVTGAGSGIGFATAEALAGRGARIVAVDVDAAGLGRLTAALGHQAGLLAIKADVTSWEELEAAFAQATERFDGLDIVCNVAGVNTGRPRYPAAERERWERTLAINLWAVMAGTQLGVGSLRRDGGGVIVNVASLAGVSPFPADPAYAAAKAGVVNLTESLGFVADERIRVVCICPGMVDTPLLEKRQLTAAEQELVRSVPLLEAGDVGASVVEAIEDEDLHAVALGLLPGRGAKPLRPRVRFENDPTESLES